MAMAVARARHLKALQTGQLPVTASALILGGGLAGMTAALGIADQGFEVHLVEKEPALGGLLRHIHTTLEGADVEAYLRQLVDKVQAHPGIDVYLNATPASISGHVGNFKSVLNVAGRELPISHGVIIVATGGQERPTELYLHGKNPHVTTQSKLEAVLAGGDLPPELQGKKNPTVVMIQCVESRNDEHPYCSRVCCSEAVKNALEIKRRLPGANVAVLGRDIRTYGFRELFFQKAREEGDPVRAPSREERPGGGRGRRTARGDGARRLEQPRAGAAARPAGALHRHRSGRGQPGAVRAAAQRPHGRRVLPGGPSQAAPGGSGQRGRVPVRPGPLAALHGRDHRPGPGHGGAGHHGALQDAPGDPRTGGQGRSGRTAWPAPPA